MTPLKNIGNNRASAIGLAQIASQLELRKNPDKSLPVYY
jgi:hypothetical protein